MNVTHKWVSTHSLNITKVNYMLSNLFNVYMIDDKSSFLSLMNRRAIEFKLAHSVEETKPEKLKRPSKKMKQI